MNIFDMRGPEFLALFGVLFLIGLACAWALRWYLRQPADDPLATTPELSPCEVAYLAGGEELAVNAAITRLIHENILAIDPAKHTLTVGAAKRPQGLSPVEQAVLDAVAEGESGAAIAEARRKVSSALEPVRRDLVDQGLILSDGQAWQARWLPFLVMASVPLVGSIKIAVGLSRGRPVEFLVVACVVALLVAFIMLRRVHRSRRGDRVLGRVRQANAALEFQAGRRVHGLNGPDLALALGLFGTSILIGGPLGELHAALAPPTKSAGASGGCGGGGCGGGCGGGGCGGCGG